MKTALSVPTNSCVLFHLLVSLADVDYTIHRSIPGEGGTCCSKFTGLHIDRRVGGFVLRCLVSVRSSLVVRFTQVQVNFRTTQHLTGILLEYLGYIFHGWPWFTSNFFGTGRFMAWCNSHLFLW